ncbi:hypothetical protein K439DRAFT_333957 [Ramaria rubella]|nr:hypothetical protein K439DRAFT_333957 [Ramaria rubella]
MTVGVWLVVSLAPHCHGVHFGWLGFPMLQMYTAMADVALLHFILSMDSEEGMSHNSSGGLIGKWLEAVLTFSLS